MLVGAEDGIDDRLPLRRHAQILGGKKIDKLLLGYQFLRGRHKPSIFQAGVKSTQGFPELCDPGLDGWVRKGLISSLTLTVRDVKAGTAAFAVLMDVAHQKEVVCPAVYSLLRLLFMGF